MLAHATIGFLRNNIKFTNSKIRFHLGQSFSNHLIKKENEMKIEVRERIGDYSLLSVILQAETISPF